MAHEELVGQTLGHYKILRPLGYGGTATVFLAEDIHLQRQVAIKLFQAQESEKADFLRRFAREARVLARLDHPNILPIYDYGEQNEHAYLVIPYMPGGSLRDFLQQQHPVEVQQTIRLISQVLQGLQYAHEHGLIHRDIKPGNMLFKANGTLLLSDFGLVKVIAGPDSLASIIAQDSNSIATYSITGTPDYMAPEQILGQATQSSDIYAIGIVLYEMLAGSRPFSADNYLSLLMKHLHDQPEPLRARNASISPAIEAVVMRALEKDTNKRYQHARDLQQALQLAQEITDKDPGLHLTDQTITSSWPFPLSEQPQKTPAYQQQSQASIKNRTDDATTPQSQEHATIPVTPSEVVPNRVWPERGPIEQQLVQQNNFQQSYSSSTTEAKKHMPLPALLLAIILILLISLGSVLYATGIFPAHSSKPTPVVQGTGQNSTTTSIANTAPVISTACPAAGSARAALVTPVVTGNQANVIYIVNEYANNQPTFGTLKRRAATAVTTNGIEIIKMPHLSITEAQISQDDQWILFTVKIANQAQLRLVRIDGQELQTLYCAPTGASIYSTQLSYDAKQAVFTSGERIPTTYLLDLTNGNIQSELIGTATHGYMARTWLDNQHVYMVGFTPNSDAPTQDISILDISKGSKQDSNQLQKVVTGPHTCDSFDSSYDATQLLLATCTGQGSIPMQVNGPSTISSQPTIGGTSSTLYTSTTQAITTIRAISKNTLLLLVENTVGDKTQNGLWKINMDGTGITRLTTDTSGTQSLCPYSQYSWSNVSPDGTLYALESYDPATQRYGMGYGSLSGGPFTQFADISDGTQLYLIGWANV